MPIRVYKPTSPGRRGMSVSTFEEITKDKPEKSLVRPLKSRAGRNNQGRITVRHQGGGHKRAYRVVDFKRRKLDVTGTVERLEHDPNRTAFIALIRYDDGELAYILAPQRLAPGDKVVASMHADVKPGNAMPLQAMPVGTIVHNIEMKPGRGGQIARSAGSYAQYVGRDQGYAILRLNSGEQRLVHQSCFATVGAVSNPDHANQNLGKAGRSRWLGRMPNVRGETMNPVDHPLGGRTRGGRHPVTPWGKPTKGYKTRNNKRTEKFIARSRHARKGS